ncbi:MAG: lysoplasmalogenase family protein [Coxiellaceae bacterium]|nr:lysoplasmalogenase family protein [Coxiellaceae bacterium]
MRLLSRLKALSLPAADLFGLLYWISCQKKTDYPLIITAKVLSTFLLAIHSFHKNPKNTALNTALVAHCLGDLVIELPIENPVLMAMPIFFIGHLCYCAHLSQSCHALRETETRKMLSLMAFAIASAFITQEIAVHTKGIVSQAIPFYATALGIMFITACLQKENTQQKMAAAALYIISDVLIAVDRFVRIIPYANYATWPLYLFGQRSIALHATDDAEKTTLSSSNSR